VTRRLMPNLLGCRVVVERPCENSPSSPNSSVPSRKRSVSCRPGTRRYPCAGPLLGRSAQLCVHRYAKHSAQHAALCVFGWSDELQELEQLQLTTDRDVLESARPVAWRQGDYAGSKSHWCFKPWSRSCGYCALPRYHGQRR